MSNKTTMTLTAGTVEHVDEIAMYAWCGGATLTTARFEMYEQAFVARRFWRKDTGYAGIELYVVEADGHEAPVAGCYIDGKPSNPITRRARFLIAAGMVGEAGRPIELH